MRLNYRTQVGTAKFCLIGIVLLCFSIGLFIFGCEESPFKPVDENLTDYPIYFSSASDDGWLFWFLPIEGKLDSVAIPWDTTGEWFFTAKSPTVSHDGKLLYQPLSPKVSVFDTETWELVTELPYHVWSQQIVASPGGQYVALPGDSLRILRTTDYSLIYTFPHRTYGGHFGFTEERFYYTADGVVNVIELDNPYEEPKRVSLSSGSIWQVLTTPDEIKWILYANLSSNYSAFAVYDNAVDSIVTIQAHTPGTGSIALSRDGKRAFFSNPGNYGSLPGDNHITEYNLESNQVEQIIPTLQYFDSTVSPYLFIRTMIVTPDNRYLIGLGLFNNIIRYDLQEERLVSFQKIPKEINNISIQSMR